MDMQRFNRHQCSRRDCEECIAGYPTLCKCGGLIHAEYDVKEEKGKFVNLGPVLNCDKCGTKFFKAMVPRRKGRGNNHSRFSQRNESNRGVNPRI